MSTGELYIVLGCFGRTDDGFVSCSGICNHILHIMPSDCNYSEIMDFLDNMQIFDRIMLDYNSVRHLVFNLQDRFTLPTQKLWSEKMFLLYQKFVIDHKSCGVFIDLEFLEQNEQITST